MVWTCASHGLHAVDFEKDVRPILDKHCLECHGPERQKSGLRLDYLGGLLGGGDHGPAIVPGKPEQSRLILRVTGADPDGPAMPFEKERLTEVQISTLRQWVERGAVWPDSPAQSPRRTSSHWAFGPVRRPVPPAVLLTHWPHNPIDRFILARLEQQGIEPSPQADRATLIRRLSLDLLGLPPSPEEVDAFLADTRPDAYERLVDRLLDDPAYGERWGRHWLDQARYADSNGYALDTERVMWPYRDWVIAAINRDVPFDVFTVEQIAGDLLPNPTTDQLIATGFHRNTLINLEGGSDPEQFRVEATMDRVNTTGSVWLGLTIGCAQCHTHKFDPLLQKEYYQLYAFFNPAADRNSVAPQLALPTDQQRADLASLESRIAEAKAAGDNERVKALNEERGKLEQRIVKTMVMRDLPKGRPSFLFIRGDFLRPGAQVTADVPEVLPPLHLAEASRAVSPLPKGEGAGANRLDLARWLVRDDNPLTPRVTVNRVWMRLFGTGLVETENDFGTQGTPPTHPELLDWLGDEFVRGGWSVKRLHRLIVTSATYRQSSHARPDLHEADPLNKLLARQNRFRFEAEIVRDAALAASGTLTRRIGGPSVHPPQPDGIFAFTQTKKQWDTDTGADRYRRGMYTFFYRSAPHPLLTTFDVPDMQQTCTRRIRSNTPLQALTVANDQAMVELARHLARRAAEEPVHADDHARIVRLLRLALSRKPLDTEARRLLAYKQQQAARFADDPSAAAALAWETSTNPVEGAAWVAAARAAINLDEFITRE